MRVEADEESGAGVGSHPADHDGCHGAYVGIDDGRHGVNAGISGSATHHGNEQPGDVIQ